MACPQCRTVCPSVRPSVTLGDAVSNVLSCNPVERQPANTEHLSGARTATCRNRGRFFSTVIR